MEEGSSRVSDKDDSGSRVVMSVGPIEIGAGVVVTLRVDMSAGILTKGADVVVGAEVETAAGSSYLGSGFICYWAYGEEILLVGVARVPG